MKGVLFWAALSDKTCDNGPAGANFCGTTCTDCTAGIGSKGDWECPGVVKGC